MLEKINSTEKDHQKRLYALLSTQKKEYTWNGLPNLKEQCGIVSLVVNVISLTHLIEWKKMTFSLPNNIQNFTRRLPIYSLSTQLSFKDEN